MHKECYKLVTKKMRCPICRLSPLPEVVDPVVRVTNPHVAMALLLVLANWDIITVVGVFVTAATVTNELLPIILWLLYYLYCNIRSPT